MSTLYEKSDGILETHVTWQDVESALQMKFKTSARFGDNKKATNISDLKGFMSKIALIEADWQNIEENLQLPHKFAVKISSQLPYIAFSKVLKYTDENGYEDEKLKYLAKILRDAHNREIKTYKLLEKFNHENIPYTKIYALKPFSDEKDLKGYIILEYIPNIHTTSMSEHIPVDDLISTIRAVATFGALGAALPAGERTFALGSDFLEYYYNTFLGATGVESILDNLRKSFSFCETSKVEKLIDIYRHYIKIVSNFSKIEELLGFHLVLNHGDFWQSNILFETEKSGQLKLKALIDWQAVASLPPGFDMARMFIGALSIEDRRQRGSELLKIYHETFTSVFGSELFPYQEIHDSYKLHFPLKSLMVLPGIATFLDSSQHSESKKKTARNETMTKMIALMEDVFEAHEYNLKNYPEFLHV